MNSRTTLEVIDGIKLKSRLVFKASKRVGRIPTVFYPHTPESLQYLYPSLQRKRKVYQCVKFYHRTLTKTTFVTFICLGVSLLSDVLYVV